MGLMGCLRRRRKQRQRRRSVVLEFAAPVLDTLERESTRVGVTLPGYVMLVVARHTARLTP